MAQLFKNQADSVIFDADGTTTLELSGDCVTMKVHGVPIQTWCSPEEGSIIVAGNPMGLLLALTYASEV
jgi:hypothetical protein